MKKHFEKFIEGSNINISNFKNLPGKTWNNKNPAYYVSHSGEVLEIPEKSSEKTINGSKSIDFYMEFKKAKYYISHKNTDEQGGAQDNQHLDVKNFLKCSSLNEEDNKRFIAVIDGKYGAKAVEELKKEFNQNNIIITTSENFEEDIVRRT